MRTALALLLGCTVPAVGGADSPPWQRAWTLDAFSCSACSKGDLAWLQDYRGKQIVLGPKDFTNPLYESCSNAADYADIRPRSVADARRLVEPYRVPTLKSAMPLAGRIRCDDVPGRLPNTVALIIIDGDRAYIPHESGALLHLR